MKLRAGVENFKGAFAHGWFNIVMSSNRLSFASAEIQKNYSTRVFLPTSREAEKRSLRTRLEKNSYSSHVSKIEIKADLKDFHISLFPTIKDHKYQNTQHIVYRNKKGTQGGILVVHDNNILSMTIFGLLTTLLINHFMTW